VAALLAGLSRLELAGQSVGAHLGSLLISPADARKASSRFPRMPGAHVRQAPGAFQFPPLLPFVQLPSPAPAPTPSPSPTGRAVHPPAHAGMRAPPEVFGVARTMWLPPRTSNSVKPAVDVPRPPPREAVAEARWDTLVRPAAVARETERLAPLAHTAPLLPPQQSPAQQGGRASPPLHGLLERLSRRPQPSKTAVVPPGAKPVTSRTAATGRARPASRLGARAIGEMLPPPGSYRSNEVLAINLSAAGLAKAREGNYQLVERIDLPEFGLTISRLRPPETLNAVSGRERLFELLPDDGFTLNRVYASYRPGAGRGGAAVSVAAQSGRGCPAERCFGGALINWQPRLGACARGVRIGIVDTGFDEGHPAFAGARYVYKEFVPEGGERAPNQHGTGVLSLLAGNADSGTPGLIPDASYVVANAFFADAGGQPVSDTAQMLRALHWLKKNGVAVVNLSLAGPEDELLHHAVQELTKAGTVVVAAAGNEGPAAPPSYPAAYEEVIAVTAVDRNLAAYRYANRGDHIDLAAPGVDVWTALPGRREGPQTGTSFAVPYVTAVVAVALPQSGLAPDDDPAAVKRRVLAQIDGNVRNLSGHGRDSTFGAGLVQAPASCGPPPAVAVAVNEARTAGEPWAGTVVRMADPVPRDPLVPGTWVSTVRPVSGEGVAE
jgi:hypothetical protein